MLTIVYCTRKSNPEYIEHLIKTSGLHKYIEIIEIINEGEGLTKPYNRGLKQSKNDIVVFCHDDILFETKQWGHKLLKHFEKNPEYGIIGVAGTKNMPASGQWWENKKKMYGRVMHTHEGKTWLSTYSSDIGNNIEDVIIVDGVFFAVNKKNIKKDFDETVEGFHFYDITFCFENYLSGVKLGVITNIRVNHKSIGITNEEWNNNRIKFAEKFKENLPVNIKRIIRDNERLKVLIGCLNFNTGPTSQVFELAKGLIKQGCDVTVCSNINDKLLKISKQYGIKLCPYQEPVGFRVGDGKWSLNTPNGPVVSQEKTLYKVSDVNFDVIHLTNKDLTEHIIRLYPDTDTIYMLESREDIIDNPQIKRYIVTNEPLKDYITEEIKKPVSFIDIKNLNDDKIKNIIDEYKFSLS